jgi:hypothetical protein
MNYPKNIKRSNYNSSFAIEHPMQQSWERFWLFSKIFNTYQATFFNKRTVPYCCIFDLSASTKHCVVQGSGQDRELEVEQSIRTATGQKEQTYTNLGFNPLSSEAVQNVLCSHWSAFKPISVSSSSWTEITLTYNP